MPEVSRPFPPPPDAADRARLTRRFCLAGLLIATGLAAKPTWVLALAAVSALTLLRPGLPVQNLVVVSFLLGLPALVVALGLGLAGPGGGPPAPLAWALLGVAAGVAGREAARWLLRCFADQRNYGFMIGGLGAVLASLLLGVAGGPEVTWSRRAVQFTVMLASLTTVTPWLIAKGTRMRASSWEGMVVWLALLAWLNGVPGHWRSDKAGGGVSSGDFRVSLKRVTRNPSVSSTVSSVFPIVNTSPCWGNLPRR